MATSPEARSHRRDAIQSLAAVSCGAVTEASAEGREPVSEVVAVILQCGEAFVAMTVDRNGWRCRSTFRERSWRRRLKQTIVEPFRLVHVLLSSPR